MVLKFKNRTPENNIRKVLIYGEDGSGKSTFAENYCKENNLKAVVIDIDDTNYTNLPILELDLSSDMKAFRNIKQAIKEITISNDFDTIILDGVTSMLELFVSKAKGIKKYGDRAERFSEILKELLNSHLNLIFIGQIDMKAIHNEDFQSPKPVIKINSIVNEKYETVIDNNKYTHKVIKFRAISQKEPTTIDGEEPEPVDDDPLRKICNDLKLEIELMGKQVSKSSMKSAVVKKIRAGELDEKLRPTLIKYIQENCPEELN